MTTIYAISDEEKGVNARCDIGTKCDEVCKHFRDIGFYASPHYVKEELKSNIVKDAQKFDIFYVVNDYSKPISSDLRDIILEVREAGVNVYYEFEPTETETIAIIGSILFEPIIYSEEGRLRREFYNVSSPIFEYKRFESSNDDFSKDRDENGLTKLDKLHIWNNNRINEADYVYVIDANGYIDKDTMRELEYAKIRNKKIIYYSDEERKKDADRE